MRSLRLRLLIGAVLGIGMAMTLAGFILVWLFESHVRQRFVAELDDHLLQLVAMIDVDAQGSLRLKQELSDPEFHRPLSGQYWQVERDGRPILRSRSLWDETLVLRPELPERGLSRSGEATGPQQTRLVMVERLIELPAPAAATLRIAVAGQSQVIDTARREFAGAVGLSLLVLGLLLAAASRLQVGAGLAPLRELRSKLETMQTGAARKVDGDYPIEIAGLVDSLNRLIETQAAEAERARSNAANLGHGLKTPLAVLAAEARTLRDGGQAAAADSIDAEIRAMNAHVARTLASARAVGPRTPAGTRTDIGAVLDRLVSVMKKLPGGAAIDWSVSVIRPLPAVRLDHRDIEDILGNLLDNARKWAKSRVIVTARSEDRHVVIAIDDDGPGIPANQIESALARGVRLDRSVQGTGVGLSIVKDLIELVGCEFSLSNGRAGGISAVVKLPASQSGTAS